MSGTLTPDILKALRMIRDGAAPPPASERLMVPSWAVQAMNDLVPDTTWRLTAAGAAVVALGSGSVTTPSLIDMFSVFLTSRSQAGHGWPQ